MVMTKRSVDIDRGLLSQAQEIMGTKTVSETVNMALQEVIDLDARHRFAERLRTMDGLDLNNPEVMKGARRVDCGEVSG